MASLQTHVLINDEWVAQNVTAEELYKTSRSRTKATTLTPPAQPKYGVLTRTIIESPIVRWVLPAQVRSARFNDVAFVGDHYVHVYELRADTQLEPIAKKVDFHATIRNCRVIGTHEYLTYMTNRGGDVQSSSHWSDDHTRTPPESSLSISPLEENDLFSQVLVLALSNGELAFLYMALAVAGDWEFFLSYFSIANGKLVDPVFHMTVSPDGLYLAVAGSESLFSVYELESIDQLRRQCSEGSPIRPVRSGYTRAVNGVVHKLEFLHPDPTVTLPVVLLIMTARSGVIRLATYEWSRVDALDDTLSVRKPGHRLDGALGLPLLIIPLAVLAQFLVITEHSMAIYSDFHGGPPVVAPFEVTHQDITEWHHGSHPPMWTAWTRPLRERPFHSDTDIIYIAREDGWLNCLEISGHFGIKSSICLGPMECRIDSGFSAISFKWGDFIVVGGDCGPGGIWRMAPRQNLELIDILPNWSPAVDLVVTNDTSKHLESDRGQLSERSSWPRGTPRMSGPDKVFLCSGRDLSGAIVEVRYGFQAKIGLDLEYSSPIKRCWAITSFERSPEAGFSMLLALPERSALLHISHDLKEVSEASQNTVDFDLLSTTLAVHVSQDVVIQITTMRATIVSSDGCYQHSLSDIIQDSGATVIDAALTGEILALSVYSEPSFKIMVLVLDETIFHLQHVLEVEGEITALCLGGLPTAVCILAGLSQPRSSDLVIFPIGTFPSTNRGLASAQLTPIKVKLTQQDDVGSAPTDTVASIVWLSNTRVMVGMKNGSVLTIRSTDDGQHGQKYAVARSDDFGVSPSNVFMGLAFDKGYSTLICNDEGLAMMKEMDETSNTGGSKEVFRVWLTNANEPHSSSPTINSVARLHDVLDSGESTWVMVSGPHILITELQSHPTPVPRCISVNGTPFGALYSERLEALVTVVIKGGIPSLQFFDPVTGANISYPVKKVSDLDNEQTVDPDYIKFLTHSDIKVVSLLNWPYKKRGHFHEWFVILASSGNNRGRLLIIAAEQEATISDVGTSRRIRFWTQFQRKIKDGSPRIGATDDDGLFINCGTNLEYHVIDDKKFRTAVKYNLPSPATCLKAANGYLRVLTTHHSLITLDYTSQAAVKDQQMILISADEISRNGLHSIDVGSAIGIDDQQQFVLVSDPMCGVYGLWSPGRNFDDANLQLVFRANLNKSIRRFVHGRTSPRWARSPPRSGHIPGDLGRHDILGLAIDGSLTQFTILNEDIWRLLLFIEESVSPKNVGAIHEDDDPSIIEFEPGPSAMAKRHVNGDILQRCLDGKLLERVVSTPRRLIQLQELLRAFHLGIDAAESLTACEAALAYEHTYGILEYYLFSPL